MTVIYLHVHVHCANIQFYCETNRCYVYYITCMLSVFSDPNNPVSVQQFLPTTWLEYNNASQHYLDITPVMTQDAVKQRLAAKQVHFWLNLLPSLLEFSGH